MDPSSGHQTTPASVLGSLVNTQWLIPVNMSTLWCMLEQFQARLGELLPLGILGVAAVEGNWKSDGTASLHAGSVAGSWRESGNEPCSVLDLFVAGSDTAVVCPYCINVSA